MMIRLPDRFTCKLHQDESTSGFIGRVARLNGRLPESFCSEIGVDPRDLKAGNTRAFERLGFVTRADPFRLEQRMVVACGKNQLRLMGEGFGHQSLRSRSTHQCAECTADDIRTGLGPDHVRAYQRVYWIVAAYRVCPRHKTRLQVLEAMSNRLGTRPNSTQMASGFSTTGARPSSQFERYLEARFADAARGGLWLDELPLEVVERTCSMIGACELFNGQHISNLQDDALRAALEHGFQIAQAGPEAISGLLARVQNSRRSPATSPWEAWPALTTYLQSRKDPAYHPLRRIVFDQAVSTMPFGPGDKCLGWPVEERKVHSVITASKEKGIPRNRLRRILEKGGVIPFSSANEHAGRVLFPAGSTAEFLELVHESMPLRAAARYLGMSLNSSQLLLSDRFIEPLVKSTDGRLTQHVYPKARLDALLRRLTAGASRLQHGESGFFRITKAAHKGGCREVDIVAMLWDGKMQNVRLDPRKFGYDSIFVSEDEVKSFVATASNSVTLKEARKRLKATFYTVQRLASSGVLESTDGCRMITRQSLDRFESKYANLKTLADETNSHPVKVWAALRRARVEPAFSKDLVGARFYERERIAQSP